MLLLPREDRRTINVPEPVARLRLQCDEKGCTLSGGRFERHFPDLQTAIDCAQRSRETASATIEIWQDGQYVCCKMPSSPKRGDAEFPDLSTPKLISNARLAAAERCAIRAGQALMATAGPLFWLCLVAMVVAATFEWQLLRQ